MRLLLALLFLIPAPVLAARGGVQATGWDAEPESWWLKGDGSGVYLQGRAWARYRFRSVRTATDGVVSDHPLWQGFDFRVADDRNRAHVAFETSVRGGVDLGRGGFVGEVLTAFVDVAPEGRWARVRLGRQLVATNGRGGFSRFDGGSTRLSLHHLLIEAYGGTDLRSRAFVMTGSDSFQTGWGRDWTYGFAVGTTGLRDTQFRLGLQDRIREGKLARRHLSIDLHKGIKGVVNVRSNLSVDLLQRRLQEAFVGIDARPVQGLRVGAEYERWQPSFDATSVWSVFDTDPYDTIRGNVSVDPARFLSAWVSGGVQLLPSAVSADNVARPENGVASGTQQAGVRVRPVSWLHVQLDERILVGAGGDKIALALSAGARPWAGRLEAEVRGDLQRYAYDLQPNLEGWYGGVMVSVAGRPVPWIRVGGRGEAIISPFLTNNFQAMATVDFLLGLRAYKGAPEALATAWLTPPPNTAPAALDGGIGVQGAHR